MFLPAVGAFAQGMVISVPVVYGRDCSGVAKGDQLHAALSAHYAVPCRAGIKSEIDRAIDATCPLYLRLLDGMEGSRHCAARTTGRFHAGEQLCQGHAAGVIRGHGR